MEENAKNLSPEEFLHGLCTEILTGAVHIRAMCELLLTEERAGLTPEQKKLVYSIQKVALGYVEMREFILDYLQQIQ
jgi:hypothetical protein